jgi:glutaconate CoA-transferase subunit A
MTDKAMTPDEVAAELASGMTIGIGGWASRRKPMALIRALLRSDLHDLTVVSFGGADVGMLCRAGKVRKVAFAFVSLDSIPLEPHFRAARQSGAVAADEYDEGMFLLALQAAAWRVPFLPTRVGLGSDLFAVNPWLRTVRSPYPDPDGGEDEELVAVPAFELDAALLHLNRADERGNAQYLGPDLYFDDLFAAAADRTYVSVEQIVATDALLSDAPLSSLRIPRFNVSGVVEAPNGAHPTSCQPDYEVDDVFQGEYAATAKADEAWDGFVADWVDPSEEDYQAKLAARPAP